MADDIEINKLKLKKLLDAENEEEFIKCIKDDPSLISCEIPGPPTSDLTLLQYCCSKNLIEAARFLVKQGADLTKNAEYTMAPLQIACFHGWHKLLKALLQAENESGEDFELMEGPFDEKMKKAVCKAIINFITNYKKNDDYQSCLKILKKIVKEKKIDIENYIDDHGRKISFYTMTLGLYDLLFELSLKIPFYPIVPSEVEKFFDLCIDIDNSSSYEPNITFKYDNLCTEENCTSISEMDYFRILIYDDKYKNLLLHPLVMCFLLLKWLKIKYRFYIHFAIYIIQIAVFVTLTFINPTCNYLTNLFKVAAIMISSVDVTYGVIMCWKFCKTQKESKNYWVIIKMHLYHILLPLAVIISVIISLIYENSTTKKLLFIPLLIAAFKFILLSRVITIYGELFFVVLRNCVKVLVLMVPLFAIVSGIYYSTFNSSPENNSTNDFVTTLVTVFYNMFVLLVGELQLEPSQDEPLNRTIYMVFILLFTIVCANLLNALVIHDTNLLKRDALNVNQREIARYIHLYEIVFKGFDETNFKQIKGRLNKTIQNGKPSQYIKLNQNIIESLNTLTIKTKNIPTFYCDIVIQNVETFTHKCKKCTI
nr:PREDICTED: transient receptor potential cation channel protein painless [Tribolium castaneum]|eukprot:XP_008190454.1 PREDICTED: transient receptor potential cation channel protein painless [Tribolium castaneum]